MWNSIAADAVMLIHFCFIAFALLGSFLVLWKSLRLHLAALPARGSPRLAPSRRWIPPHYPAGLTRNAQFWILGVLIAVNLIGYWLIIRQRRIWT